MSRAVLTIGLFDGVHKGHQAVIGRVIAEAAAEGADSAVITFDKHPADVLRPDHAPLMLTDPDSKEALLYDLGVDRVVMLKMTRALTGMTPNEFLLTYVLPLNPLRVLVGSDFRFGVNRAGDIEMLKEFAAANGFQAEAMPLLLIDGIKASSSAARTKIESGDIKAATAILGRHPFYRGVVVKGDGRGRDLGFPTANVDVPDYLSLPDDGVYAGSAAVGSKTYKAVINIGYAPTFGRRRKPLIEAHLLDMSGDIYGRDITIEFCEKMRGELTFPDAAALSAQIASDAKRARDMVLLTDIERRLKE